MLDSLRALHDQIGRAIRSLEPLAGVIKAWEAAQDVQRRAAAVAEPPVSALGAATPGEAPAASAASFGAEAPESPAQQTCPGCGGPFTPKNGRQRFCTRPCGQRFWMTQRKAARKAPGRARRRRGTRVPPETGSPADERPAWERQASRNGMAPTAAGEDLGPLPNDPERDFRVPIEDDPERAAYLNPPPLPWERARPAGPD